MCLYAIARMAENKRPDGPECEIAKEDITVFKQGYFFGENDEMFSPRFYFNFNYKRGEPARHQPLGIVPDDMEYEGNIYFRVEEGYHAYTQQAAATLSFMGDSLAVFVIPKGTRYCRSFKGTEIAAETMTYLMPYEEWKSAQEEK